MHGEVTRFVQDCIDLHGPFTSVLEVGSRNINGGVRDLFKGDHTLIYTGLDLYPGPGVDIATDFATMTLIPTLTQGADWLNWTYPGGATAIPPQQCVVCTEVLEHAPNAAQIVAKAHEALQPGGCFIMTCAAPGRAPHSALDEQPIRPDEHYENVTEQTMTEWLQAAGFTNYHVQLARGGYDLQACAIK